MSERSLFAFLLRSPWWISFLVAVAVALVSRALLPEPYIAFGMTGSLPFLVIGVIAAWRQWRIPSAARVAKALTSAGEMSWRDFSAVIELALGRQGYAVTRLNSPAADFSLVKGGRITLLSCKRWKAANQGIEPLRDLMAAKAVQGAHQCIYISLGPMTDNARRFAREHGIHLMSDIELAQLVLG